MKLFNILVLCVLLISCGNLSKLKYKRVSNGVSINLPEGTLGIYPVSNNAVRIRFFKDLDSNLPEFVIDSKYKIPEFKVSETASEFKIHLKNMFVLVNKKTGTIYYTDCTGKVFLNEKSETRKLIPDSTMGEPCYIAEQSFNSPEDESIFGLGQFQDGHFNLKGVTRRLTQVNSQIALPFMYSNKGYGLIWHQYGLTDFNFADNFITLNKIQQTVGNENIAEVTSTSGTQKVSQNQSLYIGNFTLTKDGDYSVFLDLGDMGNRYFVVIDGKPCLNQNNMWLPPTVSASVELKAGEHKVQVVCKSDNHPKLSIRLKENVTSFRSPNARLIDYMVIYGPSADSVIATYRNLSGNAPLFPKWAYGFWQCRERYTSGENLVETVKEFRKRNLPMDVIVQDWQYWGNQGWGVPQFDTINYRNPSGFIKELHDLNAHFNISIWSNPDKNSSIGRTFVDNNRFIPGTKWLDYFNPETRKEYWNILNQNMFKNGVDSWWMDAVEPENDALKGQKTFIGPGNFYRLIYPLMVSQAVYEGQRSTTSDKRVCILTRSAFLGQQRYGIINWSGDIGGTWDTYKRQIVAGLNYTITGFPYWTTDIGGFFRPGQFQYTDENYHELLTRWYQWGTFNPIFRIHGYMSETEPWKYGKKVEENMKEMLKLRYQLLPYIYSNAWQITTEGSTIMRPLIMDFRNDSIAIKQPYEFMFGKSVLVAPVTEPKVEHRDVYLPQSANWFDFWTGLFYNGNQTISANAPLNKIPLFVKAGSIIPIGKFIQYVDEKPADTLEIRIYTGANSKFNLYEDEGDTYNYEKGQYTIIPFKWDENSQILTIGNRNGEYPGYLTKRIFNIVLIKAPGEKGKSVITENKQVIFSGEEIKLEFNN